MQLEAAGPQPQHTRRWREAGAEPCSQPLCGSPGLPLHFRNTQMCLMSPKRITHLRMGMGEFEGPDSEFLESTLGDNRHLLHVVQASLGAASVKEK